MHPPTRTAMRRWPRSVPWIPFSGCRILNAKWPHDMRQRAHRQRRRGLRTLLPGPVVPKVKKDGRGVMTRPTVDNEVITKAIMLACRAPSLHNSQPWRWLVGTGQVDLFSDHTRTLRSTDSSGRETLI